MDIQNLSIVNDLENLRRGELLTEVGRQVEDARPAKGAGTKGHAPTQRGSGYQRWQGSSLYKKAQRGMVSCPMSHRESGKKQD